MAIPSHHEAWRVGEDRRNPGWRDYGERDRDDTASPVRALWDALAEELRVLNSGTQVSGAKLRNYHCAGRSVIWPRRTVHAAPHERITAHVARRKTAAEEWQQVSFAWLAPEIRKPITMGLMLAELLERCPVDISLVAFSQHTWFAVALVANGFKATSPSDKMLPKGLAGLPYSACYVLRRS